LVLAWFWLTSLLTAWSATGRWSRLPASGLGAALMAARRHPGEPMAGWPVSAAHGSGTRFYLWAMALAGAAAILSRLVAPRRRSANHWARSPDLRDLRVRRPGAKGRLILGRVTGRRAGSSHLLATESRHSVLVIGPTQSGKTSGLAIPAILEWKGPIVATSVKDDLAAHTWPYRARLGPCAVFDPTGATGLSDAPTARWSPVEASDTWSRAQQVASWLVESTPGRTGMADAAFWYTTAAKQLAPLLLAAQRAGMAIADVVRWTNSDNFDEPGLLLRASGDDDAAMALAASAARDDRIRSSVTTTLETVLAPFEDPVVAASTMASDIDLHRLITGQGTLYLCGPAHEQSRVQGLYATLVSAIVAEAVRVAAETRAALDPPLLLVLDEAANIAPIRDLDTLASTGAGLGIQLVTVCQDLAQLGNRYGPERSRTIANNHRAKLLLSGVSDLSTLDLISGLAGEHAVEEASMTHDLSAGGRSRSTTTVLRRLAPTDELRRIGPGEGVLVYGHLPPARVRLRPWYRDRRLRKRAGG
jgi:type IV secretory pathway TraG/TraD family ATPase VirD4